MDVSVSIVADDELQVRFDGEGKSVQKLVQSVMGPSHSHFSIEELEEVMSYIHDSTELRARFLEEIKAIGWVLYSRSRNNPGRVDAKVTSRDSGVDIARLVNTIVQEAEYEKNKKKHRKRSKKGRRTKSTKRGSRRNSRKRSRRRPSRNRRVD